MKQLYLVLLAFATLVTNAQILSSVKDLALEASGSVSSEKTIKFTHQEHLDVSTEYSIAFFEALASNSGGANFEIWGHGRKYLSIFSEPNSQFELDDIKSIISRIRANYSHFNDDIRKKNRLFMHSDINLTEDFIFSAYMDFQTPKFAFWYNGNKYPITEKSLTVLLEKLELYFDL